MDDLDLASLEPLAGGRTSLTFAARVGEQLSVVRIVPPGLDPARGEHPHEVDAALLRLVHGLLPVPRVLDVRRGDPAAGTPGLLVTQWLPGERGDLALARLEGRDRDRARLGVEVGTLLARLAGVPHAAAGPFVDAALTVGRDPADDLLDVVLGWAGGGRPDVGWPEDVWIGLTEMAGHAADVLDHVERSCLVHGELSPSNWLVEPASLTVTGLVDWELAHAGHPFSDLGRSLRHDRHPAWVEAVVGTYLDRLGLPDGVGPAEAVDLARAADLLTLLGDVVRRDGVLDDADGDLLRRVAETRDLHAGAVTPD